MYYDILMPQIIFIISSLGKEPSPDYIIAVTQLPTCLVPCIVLFRLDLITHHNPVFCLSLSMVYFTFPFTTRPTCWLYYLVIISQCQIYGKKTPCAFTPLYTNNQRTKTINATPAAWYYQTQSYMGVLTSLSCSLNNIFLLSYTTYHWK